MPIPIPNADSAVIAPEKLRHYVLSPTHPVGRFKAAFFDGLGYSQADWRILEEDLREQHLPLEAVETESTPYGVKYRICGPMRGPNGRSAMIMSVWIVAKGTSAPRLVTLFPGTV